jgi:hypothetical protein
MRRRRRVPDILILLAVLVPAGCVEDPAELTVPDHEVGVGLAVASSPAAGSLIPDGTEPFGVFGGVPFVQHSGFFEGTTSRGAFRMPYQIVAPQDATLSSGTVVLEPAHWLIPTLARDVSLGPEFLFGERYVYAVLGWGDDGTNVLDPAAPGLLLAGGAVTNPGTARPDPILDEEIIDQFARALWAGALSEDVTGSIDRIYGFGVSQTASALLELQRRLVDFASPSPFDLWFIDIALWDNDLRVPGTWDYIEDDFGPATGLGPVLILSTEGDILISNSGQFAAAADLPDHRVYQVAGASHASPVAPPPINVIPVVRALLSAGDIWVRNGTTPPSSVLLTSAAPGEIDPLYGVETGIARDADLNALGGVRLPELAVGQGLYIAVDLATNTLGLPPLYNNLSGSFVDLACEPRPGSDSDEPRFRNHGSYVSAFMRQVNELRRAGLLLEADAKILREQGAQSSVGKPGTC